jgi:quercetin dioxygenase-like cupin family protein
MTHSLKGYAHYPNGGEAIELRGTKMWVKAAYEDAPGAFSIIEMVHPPGLSIPLHIHPEGHEAFYVLEGNYTVECEAEKFEGIEGSFIFVPQGAVHNYTVGEKGGRLLVVSPSGLERYFREVSQRIVQGSLDLQEEHVIAEQYGQEFVDRLRHWGL